MKKELADWSVSGDTKGYSCEPVAGRITKNYDSAISFGSIVKGIVTFDGPVVVDGSLEGDLTCSSEVSIGEAGKIKANVRADVVRVFGTVLGDITAETLIELFPGSRVVGSIKAERVAIHEGVNFEGQCRMAEKNDKSIEGDLNGRS